MSILYSFATPDFFLLSAAVLSALFYTAFFFVLLYSGFVVVGITLRKKQEKFDGAAVKDSDLPSVTIQIPTRNELVAIECAKKCLEFDYPKKKFEIIIGDDSNKPEVSRALDVFAKRFSTVRVIRRKENIGFKPGNLNNMLKYSKGDIIVIFDSDFVPQKDFLRRIASPFVLDNNISGVQAKWGFTNLGQNYISMYSATTLLSFHSGVLTLLNRLGIGFLCGSAEAVRKKDLIELGGWRNGALTEDIEFSLRLHIAGRRILYLPSLECRGLVPYTLKDLFKQQMRWSFGIISAYIQNTKSLLFAKINPVKKFVIFTNTFSYGASFFAILSFLLALLTFFFKEATLGDVIFSAVGLNTGTLLMIVLIITNLAVIFREGLLRYTARSLAAILAIGPIIVVAVNIGLVKAVTGRKMDWFLLKK